MTSPRPKKPAPPSPSPALPPMPKTAKPAAQRPQANKTAPAQPAFSIDTSANRKPAGKMPTNRARPARGKRTDALALALMAGVVLLVVSGGAAAWWAFSTPVSGPAIAAAKPTTAKQGSAPSPAVVDRRDFKFEAPSAAVSVEPTKIAPAKNRRAGKANSPAVAAAERSGGPTGAGQRGSTGAARRGV